MVHTDGAPQLWMMFPMMSLRSETLGGAILGTRGVCVWRKHPLPRNVSGSDPGRFGDLVLGIRLPGNELKEFHICLIFF